MWCLARYLPLLVGDLIPEDDDHWHNFLLHMRVVDYVFAPTCDNYIVAELRSLIERHHTAFKHLYSNNSIIPKMHYMIHYPELIIRYPCMYIQV